MICRISLQNCGTEDVSKEDMERLNSTRWLYDVILNAYISLIMQKNEVIGVSKNEKSKKHVIFSTWFYTRLCGDSLEDKDEINYFKVDSWSKKKGDIFEYKKIIFPVNINKSHWACVIVDVQNKNLKGYDSMDGNLEEVMIRILGYLMCEHQRKKGKELDLSTWVILQQGGNKR